MNRHNISRNDTIEYLTNYLCVRIFAMLYRDRYHDLLFIGYDAWFPTFLVRLYTDSRCYLIRDIEIDIVICIARYKEAMHVLQEYL